MKLTLSLCLVLVMITACQPTGKIDISPPDTKTAAVPTAPPTN